MKILATGDWHGDWQTSGVDRFPEIQRAAHLTTEVAIDRRVDAYVFLGDLADPDNPRSHRAVALGIEVMRLLHDNDIPSIWIKGNHDGLEDGTGSTTLTPLAAAAESFNAWVFERPGIVRMVGRNGNACDVVALPYPDRSRGYEPDSYIEELGQKLVPVTSVLVVGHLSLAGVELGSETKEMPRGRDVSWPVDQIRKHWPKATMVGGHYHRNQLVDGVHFPGSLARLTHGEENDVPGFLVMEVP